MAPNNDNSLGRKHCHLQWIVFVFDVGVRQLSVGKLLMQLIDDLRVIRCDPDVAKCRDVRGYPGQAIQ